MSDLIQQGHTLLNYYIASYQKAYNARPMINKNTAKWSARDVVDSFGLDECKKAVDWYFAVKDSGHDWNWYSNNVERLIVARKTKEQDDEQRKITRMRAKQWLA